jgi:hypothetical protein
MEEDTVRALLTKIADTPEPPPVRIDIEQARRDGRRRQLTARAAIPAAALIAAAVALGVIVAVPHALYPPERTRPSAAPSKPAGPVPVTAPAQFNPLVPYANFGWLPSGFSQDAVSARWSPFQSSPTSLTLGAQDAGSRTLLLTVNARGACQVSAAGPVDSAAQCHIVMGEPGASKAPDVNGRPAWYFGYGDSIAWEYAPSAWATLGAGMDETTPASYAQERAPSTQTKALLHQVASQVKFGQQQPIVLPFQMSAGLPKGWVLNSVSFQVSGNKLIGTGIGFGSALNPSAGSVSASSPTGYGCNFVAGQSSYVTKYGVSWIYRVIGQATKQVEMLCSTGSSDGLVDGLQVWVNLDEDSPGSKVPLPGVAQFGGAFGIYSRLKFLGADPSGWTTAPLG